MLKAKKNDNIRARGDAAWCVRKHCGGALRHATETNQKLGRNIKGNKIKLDRPTQDEANAIIFDLDQIEYHIQSEVLPQVSKKSTRIKLRKIDKTARQIRQDIAQTGVIFYDNKNVDEDTMRVIEKSVGKLKGLLKDIDKTASHIMTQEQISCQNCVEDLVGIDGLKALKYKNKTSNTKKLDTKGIIPKLNFVPKVKFPKIFGRNDTPADKAWKTRRKKYGKSGRKK